MQLREEASSALPIFREKLATALSAFGADEENGHRVDALMAELREQAAEVRAELEVKKRKLERLESAEMAIGAVALLLFGPDSFLGQGLLLGLLPLLAPHNDHKAEVQQLETKPGFVLVKAQDLLGHAH